MKKTIALIGIIGIMAVIGCTDKMTPTPPINPEEQGMTISPVGTEKAAEFWAKMDKNSEYVSTYDKVIDTGFEKIETKNGDTLVFSFKDTEHKAEGVVGFVSFVKDQKDSVRSPEANIMVITCTDSANNNQDTTLIIPFAFYFNERPQGVDYELFAANETDTVWMGQVWAEKSWLTWARCSIADMTAAYIACIAAGALYGECVVLAGLAIMIKCGLMEL